MMKEEVIFRFFIKSICPNEKTYSFDSSISILHDLKREGKAEVLEYVKNNPIENGEYEVFAIRVATGEEETNHLSLKIANGQLLSVEPHDFSPINE